jgi:phenylacetate-CoA ligase
MTFYNRTLETLYACAGKLTPYNAWSTFKEIQKGESLSLEELENIQWGRLTSLISFAYDNVSLYHDLLKSKGIHPADIRERKDFLELPVVDKETLNNHPVEKKIARGITRNSIVPVYSSGTTGKPIETFVNSECYNHQYANLLYGYYLTGWRLGRKVMTVRSFSHGDYEGKYSPSALSHEPYPLIRKIVYLLAHRKKLLQPLLHGMKAEEKLLENTLDEIKRFSPFLLEGNAYFWHVFSNYLKKIGEKITSVKAIETDEVPLSPLQRERISKTFNCKVYDNYGSHELGIVAHGCSEGAGNHVLSLSHYVEFLEEDSEREAEVGEIGRVIVTDLTNRVMPLIRYDTGDLAIKLNKPCPCGRSYPLMSPVEGRGINVLTLNGKRYTEKFFQEIIYGFGEAVGFQVNRGEEGKIKVLLLTDASELPKKVEKKLSTIMGQSVEVSLVEDIPLESSGKVRWVKL